MIGLTSYYVLVSKHCTLTVLSCFCRFRGFSHSIHWRQEAIWGLPAGWICALYQSIFILDQLLSKRQYLEGSTRPKNRRAAGLFLALLYQNQLARWCLLYKWRGTFTYSSDHSISWKYGSITFLIHPSITSVHAPLRQNALLPRHYPRSTHRSFHDTSSSRWRHGSVSAAGFIFGDVVRTLPVLILMYMYVSKFSKH